MINQSFNHSQVKEQPMSREIKGTLRVNRSDTFYNYKTIFTHTLSRRHRLLL